MKPFLTRCLAALSGALLGALALAGVLTGLPSGVAHAQAPSARLAILSSSIDIDVQRWAAVVVVNGGTVSPPRLALVNTLVRSLKAAGTWQLTDDYWLLVAENATQALTSLKQRRLATLISTPTFVADTGYAFNGTTTGINTGWIQSAHAVAMTTSNIRTEVYERTNVASNGDAMGVFASASRLIAISPRNGAGTVALGNAGWASGGGTFTLPAADSRGLTSVSRNGPDVTTVAAYKNGVAMSRASDPVTYATTAATTAFYIGGLNSAGSLATARASTVGMVSVGAQLSAGQESSSYTIWQAHMTAVGAGV